MKQVRENTKSKPLKKRASPRSWGMIEAIAQHIHLELAVHESWDNP